MPAYWIARSKVLDPDTYWKYAEQVPGILERHGARVLSRGGDYYLAEGSDRFNRYVLIEFPTLQAAIACYESPEYQDARKHRLPPFGDAEIVLVEGGEFTSTTTLAAAAR
ncbi:DUF1330 domain-containing protein [Bordetella bronchiseptica]|uniref:DUF1330 domain-containing protein n=1 Tax=Bordetella bronchiseptica TaxID=518 RepID=UPI0002907206|nr:DUF1330 domain-containing protein [Bordetella bronchiseptica]KDD54038.1 PF07045 family protein [Bordetella bronchiseptica OSU553]AUL17024.1 hypothetical protein BTL45_19775 [Bordetella bronchiseptica]AWP60254.1 hypothetical protein B7P02_20410 [Bordetella bronchiseptica]AWQ07095.1 hypothetical protein B9G73_20960 [Bordetella bronchiseptica]KAK71932.1 PF07045 family protein [Bordetella bronchiseptica CA90 BB02]